MARKTEKGRIFRNGDGRGKNMEREVRSMDNKKNQIDDLKIDEITLKRKK